MWLLNQGVFNLPTPQGKLSTGSLVVVDVQLSPSGSCSVDFCYLKHRRFETFQNQSNTLHNKVLDFITLWMTNPLFSKCGLQFDFIDTLLVFGQSLLRNISEGYSLRYRTGMKSSMTCHQERNTCRNLQLFYCFSTIPLRKKKRIHRTWELEFVSP